MAAANEEPKSPLGLDEDEEGGLEALDAGEPAGGADNAAGAGAPSMVKLVAREGSEFIVPRECALASGTIRAMLLGPGQWKETAGAVPEVRFEEIDAAVLERVVEYMMYKQRYDSSSEPVPKFCVPLGDLVPVLLAASFLDI